MVTDSFQRIKTRLSHIAKNKKNTCTLPSTSGTHTHTTLTGFYTQRITEIQKKKLSGTITINVLERTVAQPALDDMEV